MPEDERSSSTAQVNETERLLAEGEIEVEGLLPWSSNYTFLVTVGEGDDSIRAVYKPGRGERSLWDFPSGLYRREIAAYELSESMGLGIVPETILRSEGPFGAGSLQRFVDADFSEHYFTLLEDPVHAEALRVIAGFDLVANNADRKGAHILLGPQGRLFGIDHGLCFHSEPKIRTVMWDFIGEEVPAAVLEGCAAIADRGCDGTEAFLAPAEQAALVRRARELLGSARFPAPSAGGRSYPWPLV
jgi:uncharacterized repeat protein (TIGR03843 family)